MKKTILWMGFVLLLTLALGACTRSASGPMPPTPTNVGFPNGVPTEVGNIGATQTAAAALPAQSGGGNKEELQAPTAVPQPTAVPAATATPKPTPKPKPKPKPIVTSVPNTYVLHKDEFPYCLARRFNINPDALLAVNGLVRGQFVYPGTRLTIPKNAGPFPYQRALRAHPTTYTVQGGETFYSIACLFGDVWPEAIAAANGMSVNAHLTPGQTIKIP